MSEQYLVNISGSMIGWDKPQERLEQAFSQEEFVLFSQSIVRLAPSTDRRPHFEVFVRLQEEETNLVPPGTFLPVLEAWDLGPQLDRYVVRKLLAWYQATSRDDWGIAHVNLCNGTPTDADFSSYVASQAKPLQAAQYLCFEFPGAEKAYPASFPALARGLKKIGCRISVGATDDETISFQPMKDFRADFLKIGSRLVQHLTNDEAAVAEVKTAARACRTFGVQTIAQYVESAATLNIVKKLDISFAQGYGVSRPGPLTVPGKD
jgi:EAL domain-containing protein (putative c-di-GMP-specific phosphodiesterase class I)